MYAQSWGQQSAFSAVVTSSDHPSVSISSTNAAIDEAGVHLLIFKGEELDSSTHYAWSGMEDVVTSVDQEFVHIAFSHRDEQIAWQILRYQIVEPDGTYMMDTEDMKQVGEMTTSIEARFRAVAGA